MTAHRRARSRGRPRALLILIGALLALATAALAPTTSGARQPEPDDPSSGLQLVEQTAWVAPDGEFRARLRVDAPPGATLSADLHSRLADRDDYGDSLLGETGPLFNPGPTVGIDGTPTGEGAARPGWSVTPNADGTVDLALAVRAGAPVEDGRALLPEAGVYPLVVLLEDAEGEPLDDLVLHVVRTPEADAEVRPLDVALVVPLHAPVALQPDGTVSLPAATLGELDEVVDELAEHADVPLSLVPTPETVDALSRSDDPAAAALLERLRAIVDRRQVVSGPYVDIDLAAWVDAGLDDALANTFTRGADHLYADLATRPDGRTWIADDTITPAALTALRTLGVDQVVLPEPMLGPLEEDDFEHTLTRTFDVINSEGNRQRALMADLGLANRIGASGNAVLDAHRLLADLAILHFEDPEQAQGTAVVLPRDRSLDPALLGALLAGLEESPVVRSATLNAVFDRTSDARVDGPDGDGPVLVRGFAPQPSAPLGGYPDALRDAQRDIAGYRSLLGTHRPLADPLEELELVSGAAGLTEEERLAYLDALRGRVEGAVAAIHVEQQAVTLTDRHGVLPVSVRNDLLEPISVRVRLESDRLEFPESAEVVREIPPGVATVEIPVEARASGAFPVDVRVSSPDDVLILSEGRVTVRSTAVSGLGVVLAVVAALFLAVWWARHFRSVRRANRLVSTRHPAAQQRARQAREQFIDQI